MNFAQVWEALKQELQTARRNSARSRTTQRQKPLLLELLEDRTLLTGWTPIGPAPITDGQTAGSLPVSGRVTGIAADPNNANIVYIATAGGGVWKTTNATAASPLWTPLTDNVSVSGFPLPEFMGAIAETDATSGPYKGNQIVYAGMGEANNGGDNFYGYGILVSTDGGATWTLRDALGNFAGRAVSKIVVDPSDSTGATAYAAVCGNPVNGNGGNTGIWKTTDFGQTWTNMTAAAPNNLSTSNSWSDVVVDPNNSQILYAAEGNPSGAVGNGVYKSTDGGANWSLLNGAGSFNGKQDGRISLALYDNGTTDELLVSIASPTTKGLYEMLESTNGGTSFDYDLTSAVTKASDYLGTQGFYDTTLAIDPQNAQYMYAGGDMSSQGPTFSGSPVESFDGGKTWRLMATDPAGNGPHTDDHAVAFDANGNLLDGNDGGIFRLKMPTDYTQDPSQLYRQQRWSSLNTNLQTTQFSGIAVDPTNGNVYAGSQDDGTEKYTGKTGWSRVEPNGAGSGDGGITRVDPTNHNVVYTENPPDTNGLFHLSVSMNGGTSFSNISSNLTGTKVNFYAPYVLDSSGNLYYGSDYLNFSKNRGSSFSVIGTPGTNGFNASDAPIDAVAVSPTNNNVVYVSAGGHIFVTQNAQAAANKVSWTQIDLPGGQTAGAANSLAIDPSNPATAYAVVNSFGAQRVFERTSFSGTWTNITGDLPAGPVNAVTVSPSGKTIYIGTDVGVYSTGNVNGNSTAWTRLGTGMPNAQVVEMEYVASLKLLVAATHGRGAWEISTLVPPGLALTNPTFSGGYGYTNTNTPTFTGTVADNSGSGIASVTLSINGGTALHATVTGNSWSFDTARLTGPLYSSTNTVLVIATDNNGDSTRNTYFLNVDTHPPSLTVTTPAATPAGDAYSKTSSVSFTGTALDVGGSGIASVTISIDGAAPVAASLSYAARWSCNLNVPDGMHRIVVVATDRAGNSTTNTSLLTVDTVAPTVTVTSPTVTGGVGYANTHSPMICGTVDDGTNSSGIGSVMLTIDGHASVSAAVSGGTWTYSASGLSDGNHKISVIATDKVGNTSTPSSFTLQVDTVGPGVTITSPSLKAGIGYSNIAAPTITGTVNMGGDTSGISCVTLSIDGGSPVLATLTGNSWSYTASGLSEGDHAISVVATDNLGTAGPATNFTLKVDTVAPTVTVTTPTVTAGTATVYTNTPTLGGLVTDPNPSTGIASVMVSIDGKTPFAATVNGANWTVTSPALTNGNHSVCVTATDGVGNSGSYTFTLDVLANSPLGLTIPPGPLTYHAQGAPINVAAGATVVDGASNFHGGTLTVSIVGGADPNDRLTFCNQGVGPGLFSVSGNTVSYGLSTFPVIGTFSGGTGGAPLVFNFTTFAYTNVDASVAQALLCDIQFSNSSASPSAAPRTLQFELIDGIHNSSGLVDVAVNVVVPQVAPTIQLNTSGITYTPQSPPQLLAPTGTVVAGTATNFSGGSLIVCYDAGATADDCLQVLNVGPISVNTGCVFYGANLIGTISGGAAGTPLIISLTSLADATSTGALVKAIAFQNGSASPSTTPRTVQFQLDDGSGGVSTPVTETVQFAAPPVSITPAHSSLNYTLGGSPISLLARAAFSDSASTLAGSRLIVSSSQAGDQLTIQNVGGIQVAYSYFTRTTNVTYWGVQIGTFDGNTIHFTKNATSASIQALLRSYAFSTTGSTGSRVVTFSFTDGSGNTANATVNVNVTGPINLGVAAGLRRHHGS